MLVAANGLVSITLLLIGALQIERPPFDERTGLGRALYLIDDVDGDGFRDLLAWDTLGETALYALSGASGKVLFRVKRPSSDLAGRSFGCAVALLDDLDGDNCADLVIGHSAGARDGVDSGVAHVLSGKTGEPMRVDGVAGLSRSARFARGLARSRDRDGDGLADYYASVDLGDVYLFSGSSGEPIMKASVRTPGFSRGVGCFGAPLVIVGDLNGDGVEDLGVGAKNWGSDLRGAVYLISGADGSEYGLVKGLGLGQYGQLGHSIAPIGDINADGYDDFAVSSSLDTVYEPSERRTPYVVAVSGHDLSEVWIRIADAPDPGGDGAGVRFGESIAVAPDQDGDGVGDLLVCMQDYWGVHKTGGIVFLLSGRSGKEISRIVGGDNQYIGSSVVAVPTQYSDLRVVVGGCLYLFDGPETRGYVGCYLGGGEELWGVTGMDVRR